MTCSAALVPLDEIRPWRDMHRHEMNCQIVHDSIHARDGWTLEYALSADDAVVGYPFGHILDGVIR